MIGDNIENDTTFKRDSIYLPRDTLSRAQVNSVVSVCGGGGWRCGRRSKNDANAFLFKQIFFSIHV